MVVHPFCRNNRPRSRSHDRFFVGLALVVELLAARQRQFDLGAALFVEIKFQRDERHALPLDRADQPADLPLMQQQLARTFRRVIESVGLQIFRNIRVDQPNLAARASA